MRQHLLGMPQLQLLRLWLPLLRRPLLRQFLQRRPL